MSDNEKTLTDAYYWLSMYKSGAITEGVAMEKVKEAIFAQPQLNENQKALVIWMQENECYTGDPLESISDLFLEATPSDHFPDLPLSCVEAAYQSLTNQQKLEMVSEYLKQYSEQEAE